MLFGCPTWSLRSRRGPSGHENKIVMVAAGGTYAPN